MIVRAKLFCPGVVSFFEGICYVRFFWQNFSGTWVMCRAFLCLFPAGRSCLFPLWRRL
jgi:hypothetical protein